MAAALEVGRTHDGLAVRVHGRATMRESLVVQDLVHHAFAEHGDAIVDLQDCDGIDSTFLGSLLILHRQGHGHFAVVIDDRRAEALLAPCRLDRVLRRVPSPALIGTAAPVPPAVVDRREAGRFVVECHRLLAAEGGPEASALGGVAERIDRELQR